MRISDWSSDVCSSDLIGDVPSDDRIGFFQLCDGLLGGVCCHDGVPGIFQTRDDDLFDQRLVLHHQYEYVVGQNRSVPWNVGSQCRFPETPSPAHCIWWVNFSPIGEILHALHAPAFPTSNSVSSMDFDATKMGEGQWVEGGSL